MDAEEPIVLDTSVLINYIHVDRLDLIAGCWAEIRVVEQVQQELEYDEQRLVFERALAISQIQVFSVDDPVLIADALKIYQVDRRGKGESYSFVYASASNLPLAIDDKRARSLFATKDATLKMCTSKDLMVKALRMGLVSVAEADEIKDIWANQCRYRLKVESFRDLL